MRKQKLQESATAEMNMGKRSKEDELGASCDERNKVHWLAGRELRSTRLLASHL